MKPHCRLIQILEETAHHSKQDAAMGLHHVVNSALNITKDMAEDGFTDLDISCLADIVLELENEGYGQSLTAYLTQDSHDCPICGALAKEVQSRKR